MSFIANEPTTISPTPPVDVESKPLLKPSSQGCVGRTQECWRPDPESGSADNTIPLSRSNSANENIAATRRLREPPFTAEDQASDPAIMKHCDIAAPCIRVSFAAGPAVFH
jgi:hypothetical protein